MLCGGMLTGFCDGGSGGGDIPDGADGQVYKMVGASRAWGDVDTLHGAGATGSKVVTVPTGTTDIVGVGSATDAPTRSHRKRHVFGGAVADEQLFAIGPLPPDNFAVGVNIQITIYKPTTNEAVRHDLARLWVSQYQVASDLHTVGEDTPTGNLEGTSVNVTSFGSTMTIKVTTPSAAIVDIVVDVVGAP